MAMLKPARICAAARGEAFDLVRLIETHRFDLSDEKTTQAEIAQMLAAARLAYRREVNLGDGDIVDFMVGDIAVEVKIKGSRLAIFRQCERYCNRTAVAALVLATNVAMSLPLHILGVRVHVASLGRGWL